MSSRSRYAVIGFAAGAAVGWGSAMAGLVRVPNRPEPGTVVANLAVPPLQALAVGAAGAVAGIAIARRRSGAAG